MNQQRDVIIKFTRNNDSVFTLLDNTNLSKLLSALIKHFKYETHFTSNKKTIKELCEKAGVAESMYYSLMQKLVRKKIILQEARSYYILNYNIIEVRDGEVKK